MPTLLLLVALTGCQGAPDTMPPHASPAPEVAAALDMADELGIEWGASPWSPPGWTLEVGDKVSEETLDDIDKRWPDWLNGQAVNWVDGLPFAALFMLGSLRGIRVGRRRWSAQTAGRPRRVAARPCWFFMVYRPLPYRLRKGSCQRARSTSSESYTAYDDASKRSPNARSSRTPDGSGVRGIPRRRRRRARR